MMQEKERQFVDKVTDVSDRLLGAEVSSVGRLRRVIMRLIFFTCGFNITTEPHAFQGK